MIQTPRRTDSSNTATDKQGPQDHLTDLLTILRQTTSEIHSALRKCLADEGHRQLIRPSQAHLRRYQQLDKAHELFRQAEARAELLVYHFEPNAR